MNYKNSKNVPWYLFGEGAIEQLPELINAKKNTANDFAVFVIDHYFEKSNLFKKFIAENDLFYFIDSSDEPTTDAIDQLSEKIKSTKNQLPSVIIGIGGGTALDTAKAIANLLTNPGKASDYQGWDLVKNPGIFKIGVPTLSGTGAEASRTCVMMNYEKNLKLGMNSEHTIYDQLLLDPTLTKTVNRNQYFYSAMDNYIHCIESLNGNYRHFVGDAFSEQAIKMSREVFFSEDMMSDANRAKVMVASYLGGCAIANSFVGIIHPFSAGLSVVLGIHHCLANCIVMNVVDEYYPKEVAEFRLFVDKQKIELPKNITKDLAKDDFHKLYLSTIIHEKPLSNALGLDFKKILTEEKVTEIFRRM